MCYNCVCICLYRLSTPKNFLTITATTTTTATEATNTAIYTKSCLVCFYSILGKQGNTANESNVTFPLGSNRASVLRYVHIYTQPYKPTLTDIE